MKTKLFVILIIIIFISNAFSSSLWDPSPDGYYLSEEKVLIVPEAERNLSFIIIGLEPIGEGVVFLPKIKKPKDISDKEMLELEKLIYWINLEITRGNILRKIPSYTKIFVAVPKSVGNLEKKFFLEYLKFICFFTVDDINKRIFFFNTDSNLLWAQDSAEIIGRDEMGRVLIGISNRDFAKYLSAIKSMVKNYNSFFQIKWFEDNTSAEGGDIEIVNMPDGKPALFMGRHRIMRYIELQHDIPTDTNNPYEQWMIEEARTAFSNSVYGLPVHIIPEKLLYDRTLGTDEIFHLDMYLVILPNKHKPKAFVPIYDKDDIMDIIDRNLLSKEFIKKCNEEYNAVATQIKELGFDVVRIPFYDHPVRNPMNVVKFRNKETGKITILLSKYPYHLSKNSELSPQQKMQEGIDFLEDCIITYKKKPDEGNFRNIFNSINNLFYLIDKEETIPNPIVEKQAQIYRKYGYDVILIQQFAWGSGGLHCTLLY